MIGPLSYLDFALIAVALLSGILAMYRGLAREVLSILSWLVAGGAVLYFVLYQKQIAEDIANQVGAPVQIAQIAVGAIIFLVVLIIVHLVTSRISDAISDSRFGLLDHAFGLLFGLARGFVLIVIPFLLYEKLYPNPETHPVWVRQAASISAIRSTGQAFEQMLVYIVPAELPTSDTDQSS
ncbi:MAG: CvpA family protein [Pseudomonadota bacterium]